MAKNYYRNVDDVISDPEVLAARYQAGRNIFFEVALTLAEQADNIKAASGSSSAGSATSAVGGLIGGGFDGGGPGGGGCPREDQYVLTNGPGTEPRAVQAGYLYDMNGRGWKLYNPLTKNYNRVVDMEQIPDTEMVWHETELGGGGLVSTTHKVIRNPGDIKGTSLSKLKPKDELLSCFYEDQDKKTKVWRVYQDRLLEVHSALTGTVIKFSLEAEFIYCIGETPTKMTLAHNRKMLDL